MMETNLDKELLEKFHAYIEYGVQSGLSYGDIYLALDMFIHDAMFDVEMDHMLDIDRRYDGNE